VRVIERQVHRNALWRLSPRVKGAIALATVMLCLALQSPRVGLVALAWMLVLTTFWARIASILFFRVILGSALFVLISVLGVAVTVSFDPSLGALATIQVGPLWLSLHAAGLGLAVRLFTRALGCMAALTFLTLTTSFSDLVETLRLVRVPAVVIDILTLSYRGISLLFDSFQGIRRSQDARLGYRGFSASMRSLGLLCGQTIVTAHLRGRRQHAALESRAGDGRIRLLPPVYRSDPRSLWIGSLVVISLLFAGAWK
jgi:cobalt/nickel transport system permease protein